MKILNQLTIKHLKMNKKRTIVTIIGIILSTALMVGIGLLFSTVQDNAVRTVKMETGDYHVIIPDLSYQKIDVLANNHNVKSYFYESPIGFSEFQNSKEEYRKYFFVDAVSKSYFEQINLLEGRFPENDSEIVISNQVKIDNGSSYQIGDVITLNLGPRIIEGEEIYDNYAYMEEVSEKLQVQETKTYTVVGIIEKPVFETWRAAGYTFLTLYEPSQNHVNVYVVFKKPSRAYTDSVTLAKNLGIPVQKDDEGNEFYELGYHDSLLSLYGASKYDNIISVLSNIMMIVLTLISIGCIVVIYNSFAISVMERKKQFGLFSSIGATKKQLRHTVFFEAIVVGLIGIPLGVLSSFIGIGIVLSVINQLLPEVFSTDLVLAVYPLFIILPIVFMVATILISAYIPAYKASKITPIEAIRLNDDIKIKHQKIKTGKWVRKLFGIEGEIALKNIKRNKKKYRITIASLFISIVLFVSFSTFVEYGLKTSEDVLRIPDYDIQLSLQYPTEHDYKNFLEMVKNYDGVEKSLVIKYGRKYSTTYGKGIYTDQFLNSYRVTDENYNILNLISLDQKNYAAYLKELGLTEEQPILLNQVQYTVYEDNNRKTYNQNFLKLQDKPYELNVCEIKDIEPETYYPDEGWGKDMFECDATLKNVFVTEKAPFAIAYDFLNDSDLTLIIPESLFNQLFTLENPNYIDDYTVYLKAPKYEKVDQYITKYIEDSENRNLINYFNYPKDMKLVNNLYLVIAILLYGFIALVTLIGVTSVFNTINTSIALRRKEFAMLRSMGLTPHGFNKILYFESFFFGAKSLLYGIPFSILVVVWIHAAVINIGSISNIMIPWKSIGYAVLGVFIIVFATMMYATKKMKHENILDAIREENI